MLRFPGDAEVDTAPSGMACVQEKVSRKLNKMWSHRLGTRSVGLCSSFRQGKLCPAWRLLGALVLSTKHSHGPFLLPLPKQGKFKDMLQNIFPRKQQMVTSDYAKGK